MLHGNDKSFSCKAYACANDPSRNYTGIWRADKVLRIRRQEEERRHKFLDTRAFRLDYPLRDFGPEIDLFYGFSYQSPHSLWGEKMSAPRPHSRKIKMVNENVIKSRTKFWGKRRWGIWKIVFTNLELSHHNVFVRPLPIQSRRNSNGLDDRRGK